MLHKDFFRLILIALLFASCSNTIDTKLLLGSWKMCDIIPQPGMTTVDTITFFSNDSFAISGYADGKLHTHLNGKYDLDEKKKTLSLVFITGVSYNLISRKPTDILKDNDSIKPHFQILKLDDNEMNLQELNTKQGTRYLRY